MRLVHTFYLFIGSQSFVHQIISCHHGKFIFHKILSWKCVILAINAQTHIWEIAPSINSLYRRSVLLAPPDGCNAIQAVQLSLRNLHFRFSSLFLKVRYRKKTDQWGEICYPVIWGTAVIFLRSDCENRTDNSYRCLFNFDSQDITGDKSYDLRFGLKSEIECVNEIYLQWRHQIFFPKWIYIIFHYTIYILLKMAIHMKYIRNAQPVRLTISI